MKISKLIRQLEVLKEQYGELDVIITTHYYHFNIRYVDYYDEASKGDPRICIRIEDDEK